MREETLERLEEQFTEFPHTVGAPATDQEIAAASAEIGIPLPDDYRDFLRRFGSAMVPPLPIFGVKPSSALGQHWSVIERTRRFREQRWPGVDDWLIISMDLAGNPIGIAPDGKGWISDHDFGVIEELADSFEDFLWKECLDVQEEEE